MKFPSKLSHLSSPFPKQSFATQNSFSQKSESSLHWFFSGLYGIFQVIQGLFFHPYQTVQLIVKEKVFAFLLFFPLLCLLVFVGISLGLQNILGISFFSLSRGALFIHYWVLYFCIFWQMTLAYLFFRFWYAWRQTKK